MSYGMSGFVKNVRYPIQRTKDTLIDSIKHILVVFDKSVSRDLNILAQEGCFRLLTIPGKSEAASSMIVRKVTEKNGNVILLSRQNEVIGGGFKPGQKCAVHRRFAFGNIRDSDPELAIYSFKDRGYGSRQGQPYPLHNWLIIFKDFPVHRD